MNLQNLDQLDPAAFEDLWASDRPKIFHAFSEHYRLPYSLVEELAEYDATAVVSAEEQNTRRKDDLKSKILGRFLVLGKNRVSMEAVAQEFDDVSSRNFLDVGCGMGMTMHDARALGFNQCDGLEVDSAFVRRGEIVNKHLNDDKVRLWWSDFLTHYFDCKYDLICFFDVFEQVADRELAMARVNELLTDDGLVFIYQGNNHSAEISRLEPHYRVPGLALLPRADQISILLAMGKIPDPSKFVVAEWPKLSLFTEDAHVDCHLNMSGQNQRGGRPHMTFDQCLRTIRGMTTADAVWEFPGSDKLSADDKAKLIRAADSLAGDLEAAKEKGDDDAVYTQFLIGSWEMILARPGRAVRMPGFEKVRTTA